MSKLFRYLYSSSHNPDENLSNAEYGLFLIWGQNYNHDQFKNLDTFSIVENKEGWYMWGIFGCCITRETLHIYIHKMGMEAIML